jgi:hypothetical protein
MTQSRRHHEMPAALLRPLVLGQRAGAATSIFATRYSTARPAVEPYFMSARGGRLPVKRPLDLFALDYLSSICLN